MANKNLFKSIAGKLLPRTDVLNEEGAPAYALPPRQMLAQYAATGCLNATFYASAEDQLQTVLALCEQVEPEFIARAALYARCSGFMKDLPALLCAVLSVKSPGLLAEAFDRVIDDARMLRNFVQIMRSGAVGRKSPLSSDDWKRIAERAPWQMTRMNLNTFARHGVFSDAGLAGRIAERLRDPQAIARSKVFPYQLLVAHGQLAKEVPAEVREALQDAMEIAIGNVPAIDGKVYVFPDVSGSMRSPVTGFRPGASSAVRYVDVAALIAAAVLRKNPSAQVVPFESKALEIELNPRDSVMTNAARLSALPAGGTNCSAPLALLNERGAVGDVLIYVSDQESWIDAPQFGRFGGSRTETLAQWALFTRRNPKARLVCIDLQAYGTTQAPDRQNVMNVGGFSDRVFDVISMFVAGHLGGEHWVSVIEKVSL